MKGTIPPSSSTHQSRPKMKLAIFRTKSFLLGLLISNLGMGVSSAEPAKSSAQEPWCSINHNSIERGRGVKIDRNHISIVSKEYQNIALKILCSNSFVLLDHAEYRKFTGKAGDPEGVPYLVRASAFYVDQDFNVHSSMSAFWYPDQKFLEVINESLKSYVFLGHRIWRWWLRCQSKLMPLVLCVLQVSEKFGAAAPSHDFVAGQRVIHHLGL